MMLQTLISRALSALTRKKSENLEHILNIPPLATHFIRFPVRKTGPNSE